MLIAFDIGNTHTVVAVYDGARLVEHLRLASRRESTEDEYGVLLAALLDDRGIAIDAIDAAIVGSVVPPLTHVFETVCERWLRTDPLIVGPGVKTGMPMLNDNPREVGADRIVNAIAAFDRVGGAAIVVDFGTATTFDVVSGAGEYMGGVIAAGIGISAEALFARTSKLPRVDIARPGHVIGRTTTAALQSGLVFGYVGLVEGLVRRIAAEMDGTPRVIATGGLAPLIASETDAIDEVVPFLTLEGLRLLWERNQRRARPEVTRRGLA